MADEIAWEVMSVEGDTITVQYTLEAYVSTVRIPIPSALDAAEHIKRYAPRVILMGMKNPPPDLASLVGTTGTADLEPTPPPPPP